MRGTRALASLADRSSWLARDQRERGQRRAAMLASLPAGSDDPGARSANGRAARSAASTHAVSRDKRVLGAKRERQRGQVEDHRAAAAGAVELLREPARAARDRLPRDALRRIAALVFAQAGEVGVVAAPARERVGAVARRRQRRRDGSGAGNTMPASGKCT